MVKRSISIAVLCALFGASLFFGVLDLSPRLLLANDAGAWHVLIYSRIPRAMALVITGVSLSIAGLIMQKISQNRFVSPSTAVTMDAARFGIIVALILFTNMNLIGRSLFAITFSLIGTLLFMRCVARIQFKNIIFVPLMGMMIGMVLDSITTYLAIQFDLMQSLSGYMIGSFTFIMQGNYELLYMSIPMVVLAFMYIKRFSIVSMGEDFANNLGLDYQKTVRLGILIVSMMSAAVVVTIGSVPFVGLIVPNMIAKTKGDGNATMLFDTAVLGANLLLVCDLISRLVIFPYEVPISLVLGVLGAIFFLFMLLRGNYET